MYVFARTTSDRVAYKRSTNDGGSWPSSWTDTVLKTTSAPSCASSSTGRVDLVTRNPDRTVGYTWLVNGVRHGPTNLGGLVNAASISSVGDGTLGRLRAEPQGPRLPQALQRQ